MLNFVDADHVFTKTFSGIPKFYFGCDSSDKLVDEIKKSNFLRTQIVSDQGVYSAGLVDKFTDMLRENNIDVKEFHNIATEPTIESMKEAVEAANANKPDFILGLGGGSAMDTAKVVAMSLVNEGGIEEYLLKGKSFSKRMPLSLIPTTSGTGSEVTGDAVFSTNNQKKWISNNVLLPDLVILDPKLTVTMPQKVTASTGLDVLCHALEGLMTTSRNKIVEMFSAKAVAATMNNLEKAYFCGCDIKARYEMMIAAMFAGIVNNNAPATFPHSIGYTIANRFKVPHGFSCAIGLPATMEFNLPMCKEEFSAIYDACGFPEGQLSETEKSLCLIEKIRSLIKIVRGYSQLRDVGVKEDMIESLANECFNLFPRPYNICQHSKEEIKEIYRKIY